MEHDKFMNQNIRAEAKPFIGLNLHSPHLVSSSTGIHICNYLFVYKQEFRSRACSRNNPVTNILLNVMNDMKHSPFS